MRNHSLRHAVSKLLIALFLTFACVILGNTSSLAAKAVELEIDKGDMVRLASPAKTLFVANPEIADIQVVSPTLVYIFGKSIGETTLFAIDDDENVLMNRRVAVIYNVSGVKTAIDRALPDNAITVRSVANGILLEGGVTAPNHAVAAEAITRRFLPDTVGIVNQLAITGPTQVYLRVRVAEVSRNVKKQFGINWESIATFGSFALGLGVGADIPGLVGGGVSSLTRAADSSVAFNYGSNNLNVNGFIDALADEGMISVLAEPNLSAMSGETAHFLAGGEFPIPLRNSDGDVNISYRTFGVSLSFTPTLVGEGTINLAVRPEVSQLSAVGAVTINSLQIPALSTRRAETTVELASGQSFAIAGLLQADVNQDINKFPGLGDLPVLGTLFRSTQFQRNESELVIIVTPYLVRPLNANQVVSPADGFVPPTEKERILEGRYTRASEKEETTPSAPVETAGFIYE